MGRRYSRLRADLNILEISLSSSYRFPLLEGLAFLYIFFPMVFAPLIRAPYVCQFVSYAFGLPVFLTQILILVNLAYSVASEIESGLTQTYITYPVKRADFILIKILVGLGVPIMLLALAEAIVTYMAFSVVGFSLDELFFSILASLGQLVMFALVFLIISLLIKKGGLALGISIALWFILSIAISIFSLFVYFSGIKEFFYLSALLNPTNIVNAYYAKGSSVLPGGIVVEPTFIEMVLVLLGHYAINIVLLAIIIAYFMMRFEP